MGQIVDAQAGVYDADSTHSFSCKPPTGYYVTGWQLDDSWTGYDPYSPAGGTKPTTWIKYGAENPVSVKFDRTKLPASGDLELVPHISMMHYTLSYDGNGATLVDPPAVADHYYTESVTAASNGAERTGYASARTWNTKSDGSGVSVAFGDKMTGATVPVTRHNQTVTLYAQWIPNGITVQYDGNGATAGAMANSSFTYDKAQNLRALGYTRALTVTFNPNYACATTNAATATATFEAWTATKIGTGTSYANEALVTNPLGSTGGEVTLYAKWTDGSVTLPIPVREGGYTFGGWYRDAACTSKVDDGGKTYVPTADVTLYAKWTGRPIEVSFDGNGQTGGTMSKQTFTSGDKSALNENAYKREYIVSFSAGGGTVDPSSATASYTFQNWNDKPDGSGDYTYGNHETVTNPCGSSGDPVLLYAQWKPKSITLPTPVWSGHAFGGWYAESTYETKVGDAGASFTPTNNATLYAQWDAVTAVLTLSAPDADNAETYTKSVTVTYGATLPKLDVLPTRTGYSFDGYQQGDTYVYDKLGQGLKTSGFTTDTTLSAHWTAKVYTLRYNTNYRNGKTEKKTQRLCGPESDDKKVVIENPEEDLEWSKQGYTASGWSWTRDATKVDVKVGATKYWDTIAEHCPDESVTADLYVFWQPNTYKVVFDAGGGAGAMSEQNFVYDTPQALSKNTFTKDGQIFRHWKLNTKTFADGAVVSNLTATADDTVTLTAVWSDYHWLAFDGAGATQGEMAPQRFDGSEEQALSPNAYAKTGYTFRGWAATLDHLAKLHVDYTNGQVTSIAGAAGTTNTIYAVWATNRYTLVFDPGASGVINAMADISNCCYDTKITVPCTYRNYASQGLLGWSKTKGATTPDYPVTGTSAITCGNSAIVSNVTAEADGVVTLYAVWKGVGELSEHIGLTNAVLTVDNDYKAAQWESGTGTFGGAEKPSIVCHSMGVTPPSGITYPISMQVVGPGKLTFVWARAVSVGQYGYYEGQTVSSKTNLYTVGEWDSQVVRLTGEGEQTLYWSVSQLPANKNAFYFYLADVRWTPKSADSEEIEYRDAQTGEVKTIVVPHAWVDGSFTAAEVEAAGGYAALLKSSSADKAAHTGWSATYWQEYVAGTDPKDSNSVFKVTSITFTNGVPYITWSPDLSGATPQRIYTVSGKTNLLDHAWVCPTNSSHRYFKVGVDLK